MKKSTTSAAVVPAAIIEDAWQEVGASFERFCLTTGLATLASMLEEDATRVCGPRYGRADGRDGHRWGKTTGKVGFHGGKVEIERPRVRARHGDEVTLPSWEAALSEDLLGKWALNLMLINVSTRKFGRAVRLPEGDVPAPNGAGVSKSAVSRRFVALSAERMKQWMAADLSNLDLLMISRSRLDRSVSIASCVPPTTPRTGAIPPTWTGVNGGAKLVHPGGAKLVHLTLCGTRCWGVVPVVHRRDPRCFV